MASSLLTAVTAVSLGETIARKAIHVETTSAQTQTSPRPNHVLERVNPAHKALNGERLKVKDLCYSVTRCLLCADLGCS